jgi:hypothetical protein
MGDDVRYPGDAPLVWPATVNRTAARKGGAFKAATVEAVVPRAIKAGERVTVLPLTRGIPPRALVVASAKEQPAAPPFPPTWAVVLDATIKPLLAARPERGREKHHPFEAVMVYPANPRARLLPPLAVTADLPAAAATLWAAVDLTGDGNADAAIFRFCCEQPGTPARSTGRSPCGSECVAIYLRSPGQSWRLAHQASDD